MKIEKHTLGLAAEYAVAAELCKRDIYAQLTLGLRKRTDILAETEKGFLRMQVKAKQGREWPGVKGVYGEDILILVDFEKKEELERPDFYILTSEDWNKLIHKILKNDIAQGYVIIDEHGVPIWNHPYKGMGIRPDNLTKYKERWNKIINKIS
jgi:hypothetical protein